MPKTSNPLAQKRSGASTNVILTAIVLVVAVGVIGGVMLLNRGAEQAGADGRVSTSVLSPPGSNTVMEAGKNAPTLVEFVDYQCPACQTYYKQVTSKIEKQYQGRINFVIRNYPLTDLHPLAMVSAKAAEAAALQGKFDEMYHKLQNNYTAWARTDSGGISDNKQRAIELFKNYAEQIGLDVQQFRADMQSEKVARIIQQDKADGNKAGVSGTPTFFLNGKKLEITGADNPLNALREKLDGALAK